MRDTCTYRAEQSNKAHLLQQHMTLYLYHPVVNETLELFEEILKNAVVYYFMN